jgi:hypothetical protein
MPTFRPATPATGEKLTLPVKVAPERFALPAADAMVN